MSELREEFIDIGGRRSRFLRGGKSDTPTTIFLHGGTPGVTPFCSGAHVWTNSAKQFTDRRDVVVPDMPGSGGSAFGTDPLTIDILGSHILGLMSALSISTADIVGHDLGGLIGVWLALGHASQIRSLSVVASSMSPPTADGLDNLLLVSPPQPLWSRTSQGWALDRLSYSHAHIDDALLDACVTAGQCEPHQQAVKSMRESHSSFFMPSLNRTKYLLWEACRNDGIKVPVQIVWASHDPSTTREHGLVLFNAIARHQTATQFHVINRSGSFPFREQPEAFHHIVSAFQEGVLGEGQRGAA